MNNQRDTPQSYLCHHCIGPIFLETKFLEVNLIPPSATIVSSLKGKEAKKYVDLPPTLSLAGPGKLYDSLATPLLHPDLGAAGLQAGVQGLLPASPHPGLPLPQLPRPLLPQAGEARGALGPEHRPQSCGGLLTLAAP